MSKLIFSCCVLIQTVLFGQDLKFDISNNYVNPVGQDTDLVSFNPLFKLNNQVIINKTEHKLIKQLPKELESEPLIYGFLFFTGNPTSEFKNEIVFLVKDYNSSLASLYIDKNGNLDFTDDGFPIKFNKEELIISLENENNKSSAYHYKLGKSKISPENANSVKNRYASKYPEATIVEVRYWLTNQRLSVKLSKHILNDKPITILLNDASADGMYTFDTTDFGDRIVIVEGHLDSNKDLSAVLRLGEPIDKNAVFILYGKTYGVKHINQEGSVLEIEETKLRTSIKTKVGSNVSDLNIELLNGSTINLNDLVANDNYLLLDFGGTWCGGCIMQEPTIKKVFQTKKVNIVGIFDYDTKTSVINYVKKHHIEWPVALMTPQLKEMFSVNAYPTYILIAPNKQIELIEFKSENILKHFQ